MSPTALRIVLLLPKWLNSKTEEAFPSQGTIARELGLTERAVSNAVSMLVDRGHLSKKQGRKGYGGTNIYKMETPEAEIPNEHSLSNAKAKEYPNERSALIRTRVPKVQEHTFRQTIKETNKGTGFKQTDSDEIVDRSNEGIEAENRVTKEDAERIMKETFGPKCLNQYGGLQR